jgi:hypothetical protein
MNIKYAVYDPTKGHTVLFDTKEEAVNEFWKGVINFTLSHYYDTCYMVVEQNEDGSERWYNDNNEEIRRPRTTQEIEQMVKIAKVSILP